MKTITLLIPVACLLAGGCATPAMHQPAAPAQIEHGLVPPQEFWFDYTFEPFPGPRYWSRADKRTWIERYENGIQSHFKIVRHLVVQGLGGTVVVKVAGDRQSTQTGNDGTFEVFIPDRGSPHMWLWCRSKVNSKWGAWSFLGGMNGIK